jgi:hypothetical protein
MASAMHLPRRSHPVKHRLSYASVTATLALMLAIGGTTAVGAQALLTGRNVKDESLTGADVQNDSLTGADIRAGSLGSNLFSSIARANLRGQTGPAGAKGDTGATGATGPQGPAGLGITTAQVNGDDVTNFQDGTLLATVPLAKAGDYVLFVDVTAHNTGAVAGSMNCGLSLDGSQFGGGGTGVLAGATTTFSSVGATHIATDGAKTVSLNCYVDTSTTYDASNVTIRIHNLG